MSEINEPAKKNYTKYNRYNNNRKKPGGAVSSAPQTGEKPEKKIHKPKYPHKKERRENKRAAEEEIKISPEEIYLEPEAEEEFLFEEKEEEKKEEGPGKHEIPAKILEPAEAGRIIEIVGVRYKPVGKVYFFSPNGVQYSINERVIVETSRGLELGYIVIANKNINESKVVQPLKPVMRKALEADMEKSERTKKLAKEAIKTATERIKFYNLGNMTMKLIEAEYTFDNSKLIFYFTADGRVDFRDLVKDLAGIFKTRIEMRQIGIRDQTKILGGLSVCGRPFCCASFLQDFAQVTIKMAKEQNLSINSSKISGACGRLMCCLKYEHEAYEYLNKDTPKVNSIIETQSGETGIVTESNILTGVCKIKIHQKNSPETQDIIKSFNKKSLKIIGFKKNDQEHLYDKKGAENADNI